MRKGVSSSSEIELNSLHKLLNIKRLPKPILDGLEAGATLVVASAQRQAAIRAAWAAIQRASGRTLWHTPRVFTFAQFAQQSLNESWAAAGAPDQLLPAGAEWACVRERRREAGGAAEARALLTSVHTLQDWQIRADARALGGSPEAELLAGTMQALEELAQAQDRKPLRAWLDELSMPAIPGGRLLAAGAADLPGAQRHALRRLGAELVASGEAPAPVEIATAEDDEHELDLIAAWCRAELEADPARRLLIVDAKLSQRRHLYERLLSQTLTPSEWLSTAPRAGSTAYSIEGGRSFAEFPLVAHALLTLRLLTGRLRLDEVVAWLRQPFLDVADVFAGAAVESMLRTGRKLEFSTAELIGVLEREAAGAAAAALAARLRRAAAQISAERRAPAEWAPRIASALRQLGWPGSRPLRSDEQQTLNRWHALLDEFAALSAWLPRMEGAEATATLADLAGERRFDPASVEAPVTISESHEDPVARYDGIWVAGLDAGQWPAPPRPDVFIPLGLQRAAGIPWASAAGQTQTARASLAAWRAATRRLVCSWARLEGDAHRTASPLLSRLRDSRPYEPGASLQPLPQALRLPQSESLIDVDGIALDTSLPVAGGVKPLTLQAECGFHAYAEMRLRAEPLEEPAPGLDPRQRGMLLHKALELVWIKLEGHFNIVDAETALLRPLIADSVNAAVVSVFRGYVPVELRPAVDRETMRLERLIAMLLEEERKRPNFVVEKLEKRCALNLAGGTFDLRIDRIDSIEGGGYAILDYKSGEARSLRWDGETLRDPQLIAYLLAVPDLDVQALANVSLTQGRVKFTGKASRKGLLPGVSGLPGMNPGKVAAEEIDAAWLREISRWTRTAELLAAAYIAGHAPVQPAPDVCRNCHLTVLCRRVELAAADIEQADPP